MGASAAPPRPPHVSSPLVLSPQATSCALGYMLLFLELMSTYLGGPLLHEGSFQVRQGRRASRGSAPLAWAVGRCAPC